LDILPELYDKVRSNKFEDVTGDLEARIEAACNVQSAQGPDNEADASNSAEKSE